MLINVCPYIFSQFDEHVVFSEWYYISTLQLNFLLKLHKRANAFAQVFYKVIIFPRLIINNEVTASESIFASECNHVVSNVLVKELLASEQDIAVARVPTAGQQAFRIDLVLWHSQLLRLDDLNCKSGATCSMCDVINRWFILKLSNCTKTSCWDGKLSLSGSSVLIA